MILEFDETNSDIWIQIISIEYKYKINIAKLKTWTSSFG
jgi:hypothetical protein